MRLALYQPDIPQNTGTLLRLSACMGVEIDVIGPTGFNMTDKALRRSGMDYLDQVTIHRHISFDLFYSSLKPQNRLVLLTTKASQSYTSFSFQADDVLMLGRESCGVPEKVAQICDSRIIIPMQKLSRSLNIAVAGAMVLGEALRQTGHLQNLQNLR